VEALFLWWCNCFCGGIAPLVVVLFILLWHCSLGDAIPIWWWHCFFGCVVWLLQRNYCFQVWYSVLLTFILTLFLVITAL
jgi:hypothetical protein